LLRSLEKIRAETDDNISRDKFAGQLTRAILDAYQTSDGKSLGEHLYVALLTDIEINEDTKFYVFAPPSERHSAASTIKVALLLRLVTEIQRRPDSTKWGFDGEDWGKIAQAMIRNSDNVAANKVLNRYGLAAMNDWLAKLGFTERELRFGRDFQSSAPTTKAENYATAEGLAKLFFLLAQKGDVKGLPRSGMLVKIRQMLDDSKANNNPEFNDRLNARFPGGVSFIHKTGSNSIVLADGGIVVDGDRSYILVVFDTAKNKEAMQRMGLAVLELMRTR
jgi:beta-lactamase class A